jgi:GxxExxY protein
MDYDYQVTGQIIGCAIEVHKALGPGLKEKVYENALCDVLNRKNIAFTTERTLPVTFEGVKVGSYRPDMIVENTVVVEIKSADRIIPLFTSQLVTYLRVTQLHVGLILNFNVSKMSQGIKRVVR